MKEVFGYVNGVPYYTREDYVYAKRGFVSFESDEAMIKYAKEITNNWYDGGANRTFTSYCFTYGDAHNFTEEEYKRLLYLQTEMLSKEQLGIQKRLEKINIYKYEGKPLTSKQIRDLLDLRVQMVTRAEGETKGQEELYTCQTIWKDYLNNKIVPVLPDFSDGYPNENNVYLWSDGTIR